MKYTDLTIKDKQDIINRVQAESGLQRQLIEKDWWVTAVLRALFALPYSGHMSFKGGTNLSKCWKLTNRMSEDADIAIYREYLGFAGPLSKTQISDKLRRAACSFVREKLQYDLREQLIKDGIKEEYFSVNVNITPITTTDPETIEVAYLPVYSDSEYLRPKVIVEVSGRSMNEPVVPVAIHSFIDDVFKNAPFTEGDFEVRAVVPQRTFLEKVFLLHEEFAKPYERRRTERMSRHLYDIGQMLDTPIADEALSDEKLYNSVIDHRRTFIGLKGFDYDTLLPKRLNIHLPSESYELWKKDYIKMQMSMIYGDSLPFDVLLEKIYALNDRINKIVF